VRSRWGGGTRVPFTCECNKHVSGWEMPAG
jgi:hypothetical protein